MVWLNRHSLYCTFTGLIAGLLMGSPLLAQNTYIFHGAVNDLWTEEGNWNPGLPSPTSDVVIEFPGAIFDATVYLPSGTTITINSLILGDSDDIVAGVTLVNESISSQGFILNVTGDVTIEADGVLLMQGSTPDAYNDSLFVGGAITNNGTITINQGSYIEGTLTNNGTLRSTFGSPSPNPNTINGTVTNSFGGYIVIPAGIDDNSCYLAITGDLNNSGRIELYSQDIANYPLYVYLVVSGTLTNQVGAVILDTSDTYSQTYHYITAATLDNYGTILAHGRSTSSSPFTLAPASGAGTYTNSGHIHIGQTTKINNVGTFTNTGTITIDTTGIGLATPTLTLVGSGGAGTFATESGTFHGDGTLKLDGMALNLTRAFAETDSLALDLDNSSSLTLVAPLTIGNALTVGTSSTLTAPAITNDGTLTLTGGTITGAITNNDSLSVVSGSISDALVNSIGGRISLSGGSLDSDLDNTGSITWSGGTIGGRLTNQITGVLTTSGGSITTEVDNLGTWNSTALTTINAKINNGATGSLSITGGDVYVTTGDTLVNSGTITIDATRSLNISAGVYLGAGGTLDGTGTLSLSDSAIAFLGSKFVNRDNGVNLDMVNSELHVDTLINQTTLVAKYIWFAPGADSNVIYVDSVLINQGHLTLYNCDVHGNIINEDTLVIDQGMRLGGQITNNAGAVCIAVFTEAYFGGFMVDNGFTNHGLLEFGTGEGSGVSLGIAKGGLTNTATGVINILGGLAAWITEGGLDNQGILNIQSSMFMGGSDSTQLNITNSGDFLIEGGDVQIQNLGSIVNTGTLHIDDGRKLTLYGSASYSGFPPVPEGIFSIEGDGIIANAGSLLVSDIDIIHGSKWVVSDSSYLWLYNSRITTDSLINEGHLVFRTAEVTGDLVNRNLLDLDNAGVAVDCTLTNEAGARINVIGAVSSIVNLWAGNGFINHGAVEVTTTDAQSYGIQLIVENGSLVNSPTGTMNFNQGAFESTNVRHSLFANIDNQGMMTFSAPARFIGANHTNSGTMVVDSVLSLMAYGTFTNLESGILSGKGTIDMSVYPVTFVNAGTINPGGSPGVLTFDGNFTQETTGVINIEIDGDEPGIDYDQLHVTGEAALAGTLNVHLAAGHAVVGRTYQVLPYGSISGVFDAINGLETGAEEAFNAFFGESGLYLVGTVEGGASPPFIAAIDDINAPEDTTLAIVLKAIDPDGDVLTFSASVDSQAVVLEVVLDTLKIVPQLNWNGSANIEVIVSDGALQDTTAFTLFLSQVQDAPLAFELITPGPDSTVIIPPLTAENDWLMITLNWNYTTDPDHDYLNYRVEFTDSLTIITPQIASNTNAVTWYLSDILSAMQSNGYTTISGTWTALALDYEDSTYASNGPFRLTFVDGTLGIEDGLGIPTEFALHANYPNPFNPSTTVRFDLPEAAEVHLVVYDILGREVVRLVNERLEPGYRQVIWNGKTAQGRDVPTGIYIARLITPEYTKSIKMVLLK